MTGARHRIRGAAIVVALVGALVGVLATPATAQQEGTITWSVAPADSAGADGRVSFRYELEPGRTVTDNVVVTNYSSTEAAFRLYAGDGITTSSGAFDLLPAAQNSRDAGTWVTLSETEVRLGPRQARIVPFAVTVPGNATPGDHPAGIVAALAGDGAAGLVSVERRIGARVHLRVAGAVVPRLELAEPRTGYTGGWLPGGGGGLDVSVDARNTGNVRLQGPLVVHVSALFGLWNRTLPVGVVPEVLPGQHHQLRATVDGVPPLLFLSTRLELQPAPVGADQVATQLLTNTAAASSAVAVPWFWLLLLVVVVAVVVLVRRARRRRAARLAGAVAAARAEGRREAGAGVTGAGVIGAGEAGRQPATTAVLDPVDAPEPTAEPTAKPTAGPTAKPTAGPTAEPTAEPTAKPTAGPAAKPTAGPTAEPAAEPTAEPAAEPTAEPTAEPAGEQAEPGGSGGSGGSSGSGGDAARP